jgi:hypothetical protein
VRLWSLYPGYFDAKGLVSLWREGLLARKVLQKQTRGYKNHPQLERFKATLQPLAAINCYLRFIYEEAFKRGYHFDESKLDPQPECSKIAVTEGQLRYELNHLKAKLKVRNLSRYKTVCAVKKPRAHPLFRVVEGGVESWEKRQHYNFTN